MFHDDITHLNFHRKCRRSYGWWHDWCCQWQHDRCC